MRDFGLLPNIPSQVTYCGGYGFREPPLPMPNREVKPENADGTGTPAGRVGSRRSSSDARGQTRGRRFFCVRACGRDVHYA
uniref:Uncharacterized protein n=1 Tax=uncultured prokaryote TaxID=198431 RepID=A0A0H5Q252_9ZZZZ|nr:hypothetical protein [uncultured prokaryote]